MPLIETVFEIMIYEIIISSEIIKTNYEEQEKIPKNFVMFKRSLRAAIEKEKDNKKI